MTPINPTTVWLSDHILLSDLVGCDSVYRHGYANPVFDTDHAKLREGYKLAETLEPYIRDRAVSFTYGYVCPMLSQAIVKYQDPRKPSYHRWDKGAACDLVIHTPEEMWGNPLPAAPWTETGTLAWGHYPLDELSLMYTEHGIRWSRAITYAESDIFCFATQISEKDNPRMATYENRYMGPKEHPYFGKIKEDTIKSGDFNGPDGWRGRGWPHTHGNGRRQYEHVRTGVYSLLSDFLYDSVCVHKGIPNRPPLGKRNSDRFMLNVMLAGIAYEHVQNYTDERLAIVAGYVNPAARHTKIDRSFQDHFVLDLKVPEHGDENEIVQATTTCPGVYHIHPVKQGNRIDKIRLTGHSIDRKKANLNLDHQAAVRRLAYEHEFFLRGSRT